MIRILSKIKIIILVGITAFIVIGSFNLSRSITQIDFIKNIDKEKLDILVKNNEELQIDKKNIQEKLNQEIEDELENKPEEEYVKNRNNNEAKISLEYFF